MRSGRCPFLLEDTLSTSIPGEMSTVHAARRTTRSDTEPSLNRRHLRRRLEPRTTISTFLEFAWSTIRAGSPCCSFDFGTPITSSSRRPFRRAHSATVIDAQPPSAASKRDRRASGLVSFPQLGIGSSCASSAFNGMLPCGASWRSQRDAKAALIPYDCRPRDRPVEEASMHGMGHYHILEGNACGRCD